MLSPLQASDESERTPIRTTGSVLLLREPPGPHPVQVRFHSNHKKSFNQAYECVYL